MMSDSEFFVEEAELLEDDDIFSGVLVQKGILSKAVHEQGLDKEIVFKIDPVVMELDISISAYALAKLLGVPTEEPNG